LDALVCDHLPANLGLFKKSRNGWQFEKSVTKMVSLFGLMFHEDSWYFLLGWATLWIPLDVRLVCRELISGFVTIFPLNYGYKGVARSTRRPYRCTRLDSLVCDHLRAKLGLQRAAQIIHSGKTH
jgi:hypothetical protein